MSTQPLGQEPGTQGQAPNAGAGNDLASPLSMLADLEARISGLKKMHEQTAARESVLSARELELARREQDAVARTDQAVQKERDLANLSAELMRQQEEIRTQQAQIQAALAEISQQRQTAAQEREREDRQAIERRAQADRDATAEREREAAEAARRLAERERALEAAQRQISEREAGMARRESELATRDAELAARDATIRDRDRALKELTERIDSLESELDRREAHAGESEQKLSEREKWLLELEASIERRRKQAEDGEQAAAALEIELTERDERLNQREQDVQAREKSAAELAVRQQALAAMESQIEERQRELREELSRVEREKAEILERERALAPSAISEQTSAIYSGRTEELQLKLGEAASARAALQTEVEHLREELAQTRRQLDAMSDRPSGDDVAAARAEAKQAADRLASAQQRLAAGDRRIEELESKVEELARQARIGADAERVNEENDRLKRELGARDEAIVQRDLAAAEITAKGAALEKEVAALREQLSAASSGADPVEIEKRDQAIVLLKQRVDKVTEQNAALNAKAQQAELKSQELEKTLCEVRASSAAGEAGVGEAPSQRVLLRQQRLRQYKKLLQTQARKIVAAQAALQKRHADCEQVLAQRVRVAALAESVTRREKRLAGAKARSGTAAALAYTVATLGLLAGLSWEISKRVWPGTYVSRAKIEIDARDRSVSPEKVLEWQRDMQQLVHDPRLMEVIAERMKRRGFETLGTPGDVRELIDKSVFTQSVQGGTLDFELRAEGSQRSQMLLDTIVTSFKSVADESKGERAHDLGVNIASPAAAADSPLMDQRIQQAGMIFGGNVLVVGLLGGFIYTRLAAGKKAFDARNASDAMGDVDWATLEATFKKNAGPNSGGNERAAA